jgi:hypothetical protein
MLSKIILRSNPNTRRVLCFNEYDVVNEWEIWIQWTEMISKSV